MPRFAVILPAAGRSSRFLSAEKKVFADLEGRPVWLRSAEWFLSRPDVCQCLVVTAPEDRETFRSFDAVSDGRIQLADGGTQRFESVANALALTTAEANFVAVHDAARPCLTAALIDKVFESAVETGAALLAVRVADTIKRDDGAGRVQATVPRQGLWLAQTPQVFRRDWLIDAYARRSAFGSVTDDAQLVEAAGHAVHLVPGSNANLKITTREDLGLAEAIRRGRR
jgi:2-C-methyl-D-erythritol 4-phosphate cytidylyltransferase